MGKLIHLQYKTSDDDPHEVLIETDENTEVIIDIEVYDYAESKQNPAEILSKAQSTHQDAMNQFNKEIIPEIKRRMNLRLRSKREMHKQLQHKILSAPVTLRACTPSTNFNIPQSQANKVTAAYKPALRFLKSF